MPICAELPAGCKPQFHLPEGIRSQLHHLALPAGAADSRCRNAAGALRVHWFTELNVLNLRSARVIYCNGSECVRFNLARHDGAFDKTRFAFAARDQPVQTFSFPNAFHRAQLARDLGQVVGWVAGE